MAWAKRIYNVAGYRVMLIRQYDPHPPRHGQPPPYNPLLMEVSGWYGGQVLQYRYALDECMLQHTDAEQLIRQCIDRAIANLIRTAAASELKALNLKEDLRVLGCIRS